MMVEMPGNIFVMWLWHMMQTFNMRFIDPLLIINHSFIRPSKPNPSMDSLLYSVYSMERYLSIPTRQ